MKHSAFTVGVEVNFRTFIVGIWLLRLHLLEGFFVVPFKVANPS